MRNVADKNCIENENAHFMFNNPPPKKSEIVWKNMVELDRPQMLV